MKKNFGIILFFLLEILIVFLEKKVFQGYFAIDRIIFFSVINIFICMHFLFELNKMYDVIFKKRYIIGIILLIYITLMGYSGSSMSYWNGIVQPNNPVSSGEVVLGIGRGIRGDEFFVSTPMIFSQKHNDFNYKSAMLLGREESVVLYPGLPSKHISILGRICNIAYLILPLENAYSFVWFFNLFLIFFASFELCLLITDNKRLYALLGTMLITFSGVSCWWSNMPILGWGALTVVLFNKFLKSKETLKRIFYSIIIGIVFTNFVMIMYPAWQVPFGYLYLGFAIWLMIENKENLKFSLLWYLPIVIFIVLIIFIPTFLDSYNVYLMVSSTVYPGARLSVGGGSKIRLYMYYLNLFFPYKSFFNPSEYSNFISFYPIPIIISIFYMIRSKIKKIKIDVFLLITTVIAILLSIWNYVQIPEFISKISLMSFSTDGRAQLVVGYACIFLMIRFMSKYEKNIKYSLKKIICCILLSTIFNLIVINYVNINFDEFFTKYMIIIDLIIFVPIVALYFLNNEKTNKFLAIMLIILTFFTGMTVNPITKGIGVFFDKPVSKEIRNIVEKNPSSRWIAVNSIYSMPNYLVANGAITINSTNFYPNIELWKKFDKNMENEFIYNRYAHVRFDMTYEESYFELLFEDSFMLHLNANDLKKLNVQYILSLENVDSYLKDYANCVYNEDGVYIYEVSDDEFEV